MSYTYNGEQLTIVQPLHSISVNNNKVVFSDQSGPKHLTLANTKEAKRFLNWLVQERS
ncbi:hypothetical protein KO525_08655 [Psychrosphaera sp. B3R10]|uniref:Uncharacterized protein n=1 Tax=Psychrosphaera algicola TaxID=3023714 RepID=A0ABT5FDE8_9GAMM|nr:MULTISPECIES: hypothetical protein [unclassified Psychrosphaera]MBU2882538.1 hypothetical protein [Psychrosphaera sp. I2R16]MBU2989444.1 hypothetical protein [Psychrosphaera sp. B3R10]MDC2889406.1 hypothetical protein [Psychrosphaera sp. G1-22]MDO6718278.1 hypothetical protein [Psychrosphaera sp. 1_MG-2023]